MLEILAELFKNLAVKAGAVITGFFVSTVMTLPGLPENNIQTQTSVAGASTSAQTKTVVVTQTNDSEATCTVTVNGETKTYTYKSDSGSQTVVCGSQNGQSFSSNVDTGKMLENISGQAQNIKNTLKSLFPSLNN